MKLNIYGHQPIIAPRDPVLPMEVATKNYVDTGLEAHINNANLHLTSAQNTWIDAITVTSGEVNYLGGVNANVQDQLNAKVNKAGDVMTGSLVLSGMPTENLHASPKGYVDAEASKLVSKAGSVMTGLLTLSADPSTNMQAATKQYVDSTLVNHINDEGKHLTAAQNLFLDALTVTAAEVNHLVGVTAPVQGQLDAKFDKVGGAVTGDITLSAGKAVFVSKPPLAANELVNKAYVDSKIQGQEWKDPVSDIGLVSLSVTDPLTATLPFGLYIVGVGGTGAFAGKDGWPIWVDADGEFNTLKSSPVAVGDRFGVNFGGSMTLTGSLAGKNNSIITITDATIGAMLFSEEVLVPGATTLVFDENSYFFGNTYSFTDESAWVLTNTSVSLEAGSGLSLVGKVLNVNVGSGLVMDGDDVDLRLTPNVALYISPETGLNLRIDEETLVQNGAGNGAGVALRISDLVLDDISDRLSKTSESVVTGSVTFGLSGELALAFTPVSPAHAVNKGYVDSADVVLQNQLNIIGDQIATLESDPTTKTYVDTRDALKVNKAGDTLTGFLTLHAAPSANLHAATKQYVDSTLTAHMDDEAKHLTAGQNVWLDAITATSAEVNHLVGVTGPVQTQLDALVSKSGSVMTGPLVLSGAPSSALEAATKDYVDTAVAPKVNRSGDTLTGFLSVHAAPTANLHVANKQYVDSSVVAASDVAAAASATKVNRSGDTLTGFMSVHAAPTGSMHVANKQYVDAGFTSLTSYVDTADQILTTNLATLQGEVDILKSDPTTKQYIDDGLATKVNKAGDTLTGYIVLHADPQLPMQPATKQYVDAFAQGLAAKPSVRLATLVNVVGNYSNGTQGVNATLTGATNGAFVADGVTPNVFDRVLIKNQTNKMQNGDYVVQQVGDASTPFILKRTTTADQSSEVPGSYFYVFDGATLKGTGWVMVVDAPVTFAIGTDNIEVSQFSGQGNLIAGGGVYLDGNTLHVGTANSGRIVVTQDAIDLATTGVTPGSYTKVTIDGYGRVTAATNPTTIAGYGISDAQALNTNLTNLSNVSTVGILVRDAGNGIATRSLSVSGVGLSISNANGASGSDIAITSNATPNASLDTVVSRDGSGNFSANVITSSLVGNASTATALQTSRTFAVTGDATAEAVSFNGTADVSLNLVLDETGVVAGAYTKVTVDAKGRVTLGSNPSTVAAMGLIDAATIDMVNAKFTELEEKFEQLYLYVMGRI